jgi:hypothetical protein
MMKHFVTACVLLLFVWSTAAASDVAIDNPYHEVDWAKAERLKANLHTHTTRSDGSLDPAVVIDAYHQADYDVLAITDHNASTWPWTDFGRDPEKLDMIAIAGNEFSSGHHRNAWFVDIDGNPGRDVAATLELVQNAGGLSQLNHPGRYTGRTPVEWYVDLVTEQPTLIGMEVYNQGDRYPKDREHWDAVLTRTMPDRPLWGFSNDDMHKRRDLFGNYNIILATEKSKPAVRAAMIDGRTWFSYEPEGEGKALAPEIESITVENAVITIQVKRAKTITWIADGKAVATGEKVDVAQLVAEGKVDRYLRAQIDGEHGTTCTQPFGVRREAE